MDVRVVAHQLKQELDELRRQIAASNVPQLAETFQRRLDELVQEERAWIMRAARWQQEKGEQLERHEARLGQLEQDLKALQARLESEINYRQARIDILQKRLVDVLEVLKLEDQYRRSLWQDVLKPLKKTDL